MESISVVVPVFNEAENVVHSYFEIAAVLERTGRPFEVVFVDDGSSDGTVKALLDAAGADKRLRIVQLRRNFGQTAAIAAGIDHAIGEVIVTIDGDLQNDPADIPGMIEKLDEGHDMVAGWRKDRKDRFINRRLPSMIANWIISKSTNVQLHDYGCTLKVIRGDVARGVRLYGEMHRFIPALADQYGASIVEMPVNHRARKFGRSKYGITRTIRVILDLITVKFLLGYSKRPIHLFGTAGVLSGGAGALLLAILTYQRFFQHVPMGNRPLLSLGVMLIIIGLQFVCFGLLAEVMARTYYESQGKRTYTVRRVIEPGGSSEDTSIDLAVKRGRKVAN